MHKSALVLAQQFKTTYLEVDPRYATPREETGSFSIGEFGSMDVNGSLRPLFEKPGIEYIGFDLAAGKGVDKVVSEHEALHYYRDDASPPVEFDVWLSCSTLEHVRDPAGAVLRMASFTKPGGLLWLCVPWSWPIHRHPLDCWRILPDGMRYLLEHAALEVLECDCNKYGDTVGIARRR